jgi:hypothetical protein
MVYLITEREIGPATASAKTALSRCQNINIGLRVVPFCGALPSAAIANGRCHLFGVREPPASITLRDPFRVFALPARIIGGFLLVIFFAPRFPRSAFAIKIF